MTKPQHKTDQTQFTHLLPFRNSTGDLPHGIILNMRLSGASNTTGSTK